MQYTTQIAGTTLSHGTNCTGSEMGNLYYNVLGGSVPNANYYLFDNIQAGEYWSATESYPLSEEWAWYFNMDTGIQANSSQINSRYYAWAVHDGDVAVIPVPAAFWLFGSGLMGLVGIARRKKI